MSLPTMHVISADDGTDGFERFVTEVNKQLAERGCLGNADATEMSFDVSVMDAAIELKAEVKWIGTEAILVALDGAPIQILEERMEQESLV